MTPRHSLLIAATLASLSASARGDALNNVAEVVAEGYVLVYSLDLPANGGFRDAVPVSYTMDDSSTAPAFDRIAYYLEIDDGTGSQWVYASMSAFTANVGEIGLPHNIDNPVNFQQTVSDLNVASNVLGIVTGNGLATGNIEFWPSNYSAPNTATVPNASAATFDFGDGGSTTAAGYGSFQIHNYDVDGTGPGTAGQTLLAYNRWGGTGGGDDDLGIGTSPGGQPDYTFAGNAGSYVVKTLQVLVRPTPFTLELDAFPQTLEFCPRDLVTNLGEFEVAGRETTGGFTEAVLRISREGVPYGTEQVAPLDYSSGPAEFSFTVQVPAELAQFGAELVLRDSDGEEYPARQSDGIVVGDVYIVQGQSNADSRSYNGSANGYQNTFVRTFGQNSSNAATTQAAGDWLVAQGNGSREQLAGIGQWPLVMANVLATESGVAIAILNGADGGKPISFFQRDDTNSENLATNYGRLLHRARKSGLTDVVRGFFFYQGEAERGNAAVHEAGFLALHSDWKEDYPSAERFYVFQLHEGCGVGRFNVGLRDLQRRFQDRFPDMTSFSVNGLDGHDGCHYAFAGGYELMGMRIADLVARDFYGAVDDPNIEPPNPASAEVMGVSADRIRIPLRRPAASLVFEAGAEADFALVGSNATVVSGTIVDGAIELQLSSGAAGAEAVVYGGHIGAGPWVRTTAGATLFSFSEPLIATGPVPRFISPARTGTVDVGGPITIEITADEGGSPITSLELLIGPNLVSSSSGAVPLQYSWTPPAPGAYRLTARATDGAARVREAEIFALAGRPNSPGGVLGASVWLRAETGIEVDATGKVTRWLDQSGNGNHAEQLNASLQPTFAEGTFGCLPAVRLLPGQFLTSPSGMSAGSYTKVVRYNLESLSQTNNILSSSTSGTGTHALFHGNGAFPLMFHSGTFVTGTTGISAGEEVIVVATYDAGSNLGSLYVNGIAAGSGTATADNPSLSYQIGAYNSSNTMNGAVGEVLIFPRVLDGTERAAVITYLDGQCLTAFGSWQRDTPGGLDLGDLDWDRLPASYEFALGLDPLVFDSPIFVFIDGAGIPTFGFDRPLGYDHVLYEPLVSADLQVWHSVPVLLPATPTPGNPLRERIAIPLGEALPEGTARFGKLRVVVE